MKFCRKRFAFALAEVLITLGIIGVVAALSIPALTNKTQETEYKTAYKKAYSALSQAVSQANTDNVLESPTARYDEKHWINFKTIISYLKLQKTCWDYDSSGRVSNNTACWAVGEGWNPLSENGYPSTNDITAVDVSGMSWGLCARGYAALYAVDTNGSKKPNQMGKDRFVFSLIDVNGSLYTGIPVKVSPLADGGPNICEDTNKCAADGSYYGKSWLYN